MGEEEFRAELLLLLLLESFVPVSIVGIPVLYIYRWILHSISSLADCFIRFEDLTFFFNVGSIFSYPKTVDLTVYNKGE